MKRTIPSAQDVQAQGQVELDFGRPLSPQDTSLPKPKGAGFIKRRRTNTAELVHLNAVIAAGGLVPDDGLRVVWRCSVCSTHFKTQGQAHHCHRAEPELVEICVSCSYPLSRCSCSWRLRH
jgi:hypothetical protein